jgi:hypothetical protein
MQIYTDSKKVQTDALIEAANARAKARRPTVHIEAGEHYYGGKQVFKISDPYLGEYSELEREEDEDEDQWKSRKDNFVADVVDRMGWNLYNVIVNVN